jgi:hypothetical protein
MVDLSQVYRSRTQRLPEDLNRNVFNVEDSVDAQLEEWLDNGVINNLASVIEEAGIPFDGTYFIVDVGGPHLPGIGKHFLENGIDPYFLILIDDIPRMQETLKFWQDEYADAKARLDNPRGYATLIPGHRRSSMDEPPYSFLPSSFPTAEQLVDLGIERVVYMNEGTKGPLSKRGGAYVGRELAQVVENYESAGLEFSQYGLGVSFDLKKER